MAQRSTFGFQAVTEAIAFELTRRLPGLDTDYGVIAEAVAVAIDLRSAELIDEREAAMQTALAATMTYYNSMVKTLRAELEQVRAERTDLVLKLAARGASVAA